MKTFVANRCLLIATAALITWPLIGFGQETVVNDAQASSQRLFVSDKLVLNVYAEPDQSSSRVATIQTGDVVEELERATNMVRVRLEDGREGWVGASYLTSDAPAAARLRELERHHKAEAPVPDKKPAEEIARLKEENAALKVQVNELQSRTVAAVAAADESARMITTSVSETVAEERALADTAPTSAASVSGAWLGWLIAVVLTGAVGFAGGYQTLARRIRRKFGGLKIY